MIGEVSGIKWMDYEKHFLNLYRFRISIWRIPKLFWSCRHLLFLLNYQFYYFRKAQNVAILKSIY